MHLFPGIALINEPLPAFPVCRIPGTVRASQSVFTSEDYKFRKNCSSSIAASPMSRVSMHLWAESIAGQIGKAAKPGKRGRRKEISAPSP
ncbi:hypothetical protein NKH75_11165 [Mesorhizobium sp. M0984]|uniref:hypothetical protein n=1 Tax=unclassified Mesorhizobium TaxID=325217 RepID=UPI0033382270